MIDDEIRSAIESGRLASAKREIASKLKRFPQKSYYHALQAYYLVASGDNEAALKLCNELKQKVPSDPSALELLAKVYTKLVLKAQANEIYENAVKKYPSTDLILVWFTRAVAQFDTRSLQKSGLQLQKHAASSRLYKLWAAMSGFLWASEASLTKEAELHLGLAAGLMEKLLPFESNQEAFLYASILLKQSKLDRVVEILEPLLRTELELRLLYLNALDATKDWERLHLESKKLLFEDHFNDFDTWKYLIRASHELNVARPEVQSLIALDSRNSFMANIEIASVYGEGLERAIDEYYSKYATKPCCALDLSMVALPDKFYVKMSEEGERLLQKPALSSSEALTLLNIEKLLVRKDPKRVVDWAKFKSYKNPELFDLYIISMIQSLHSDLSTKNILKHILNLEYLAQQDSENFKLQLWILNLYSTLSTSQLSLATYKGLKIKLIQHDIIGYKLNLEPTPNNTQELFQIYRFYLTGSDEVQSQIELALQKGLYTKLEDFYTFGKRLHTSLSKHMLTINLLRMTRMLQNTSYHKYLMAIVQEDLADIMSDDFQVSDNRDFKTDYKLGCPVEPLPIFNAERERGMGYVRLHYIKELLLSESSEADTMKQLKTFNKWIGNQAYIKQLSPFEAHLFKLYASLFKILKGPQPKDKLEQINYLVKNLEFKKIRLGFLSKVSPLSNSANQILVGTLELVKSVMSLTRETAILNQVKKLHTELDAYTKTNPEREFFKELRTDLVATSGLDKSFVDEQLDKIENGIAMSAFKIR